MFVKYLFTAYGTPTQIKRRAVETLLNDEEWGKWSDREIARRCGVSPQTVVNIRSENLTVQNGQSERQYTTKHGTPATMRTGKIGKAASVHPRQDAFSEH